MRFSASRLSDIAAIPSIAASFQGGGIIAWDGEGVDKKREEILCQVLGGFSEGYQFAPTCDRDL
jgi:hypothetical protein